MVCQLCHQLRVYCCIAVSEVLGHLLPFAVQQGVWSAQVKRSKHALSPLRKIDARRAPDLAISLIRREDDAQRSSNECSIYTLVEAEATRSISMANDVGSWPIATVSG
jgi:hypothetical protein